MQGTSLQQQCLKQITGLNIQEKVFNKCDIYVISKQLGIVLMLRSLYHDSQRD